MSWNEFTESGNIVFAMCDMTHLYSELTKLGDWRNWEQYGTLAFRIGGVMISDFWIQYDVIQNSSFAGDGYATGIASGNIVADMLDTLL